MTSSFRAADLRLPAGPVDLTAIDSGATPGFDGDKTAGKAALAALGDDLSDLQERLYAEGSADVGHGRARAAGAAGHGHVGQGRHAPAHRRVWSIRRACGSPRSRRRPRRSSRTTSSGGSGRRCRAKGIIGVFDRSHYEDVLIVRVHELAPKDEIERRYDAINAFEAELVGCRRSRSSSACCTSPPTTQKERLLARLDDPTKHWKFNPERHRRACPLAGVPRGLRDRARADQHRGGAVVRRTERPQVVPQPGHRQPAARDADAT